MSPEKSKRSSKPEHIGAILRGEHKELSKYQPIWEHWRTAVGAEIAERAYPESVALSGILTVGVNSSVWMQELQFLKPKILEALNTTCGASLIKDILFRPRNPKRARSAKGGASSRAEQLAGVPTVDRKNASIIREKIESLHDAELKNILSDVLQKLSR